MRKYIRILLSVLTVLLCLSAAAACAGTQSEERPEETERPVAIEKLSISFYDTPEKEVRYVGGIAAVNHGTLYNCTVSSAKYFYVANENSYAGGLVGLNEGLITESRCYVIVFGDRYAGGIAGKNTGTIEGCANLRNLFVDEENAETGVSGIVGENSGTVTDSAHFAKVYVGLENFNFSEEHEDTAA